ncbi:MAG: polysaccharide deacetylase family protein [Candidatus Nanoarchaeia archaeon]|jgi:peptidoglycan/xylan/chitin deacetylase (PgdA/CDA1 family)
MVKRNSLKKYGNEIIIGLVLISLTIILLLQNNRQTQQEKELVLVNLQVTEYKNPEALVLIINELESRNMKPATIFIGKDLAINNCSLIRSLDSKGYEIGIFGYALNENGAFVQIATLNRTEQEKILTEEKEAVESCLGHEVNGFRAQRFSKNNDTHEIIRNLGFSWDGSFVVGWDNESSTTPYYSTNYCVYIVSIENVPGTGAVLCDTAMSSNNKTATEWKETIKTRFMEHQESSQPFITEFHPYFLIDNPEWYGEFINLIDWLKDQNAEFLTTTEFINRTCEKDESSGFMINQSQLICGE